VADAALSGRRLGPRRTAWRTVTSPAAEQTGLISPSARSTISATDPNVGAHVTCVGRGHPRDLAIFLIMRFTGMRRESVATLKVRNLDPTYRLRRVLVKGGKARDIPLTAAVIKILQTYVELVLAKEFDTVGPETRLFWSTWGRRAVGKTRAPMTGKNIWRLCKVYGRRTGYPELKPHDLRHGVATEVYEEHGDLEPVRALLGHARIDTTQI
jgi:integrase/recombinase XerC